MSRWYHAHKGKTVGPFTQEEIPQMVTKGQVGIMDLIFKVGGNEWKPLIEWSEFKELKTPGSKEPHQEQWIIFLDRPEDSKQIGPFNTLQVREMLINNHIRQEDYIWKEGMSEWYPIKTIQEFKSKKEVPINFDTQEVIEDVSVYEDTAADLLKSIKVKDPKQIKEITETISRVSLQQTVTLTNKSSIKNLQSNLEEQKNKENNSKEDRKKQRAEIQKVRRQLEDKIKTLFGEEPDLSNEDTKHIQDTTQLDQHITSLTESLPLTQRLVAEGFIESKNKIKESIPGHRGKTEKKRVRAPVVKILQDEGFFEEKENPVLRRIKIELEGLFPKGSLLRIFALFFIFFASTVMIFLSSHSDKNIVIEQKNTATDAMTKAEEKYSEIAARKKEKEKERKRTEREQLEKIRLENLKIAPTQLNLKVFKNSKTGRELFLQTDASKHYKYIIEISGLVGEVLGVGAYYNRFESPIKDSLRLNFEKMKLPEGYLNFRVSVGGIVKTKRIFNSVKDKNSFAKDIANHKKQIAVWHQKEKRSLYSTIENLKNWGMQVTSLIPLHRQGKKRWQRAYRNWKNKVSANQSDYLKTIHFQAKGKFIYPQLWLKLQSQFNLLYNIPSENPEFDFVSFKNQISALEKEVNELSLW